LKSRPEKAKTGIKQRHKGVPERQTVSGALVFKKKTTIKASGTQELVLERSSVCIRKKIFSK
jgi:hypothetical protein